ncbi:MAG TPA: phosphotransferase [Ktedonobacterales bacterium]|nr:phosphotransferase [Ktedonobacterales bacterium]
MPDPVVMLDEPAIEVLSYWGLKPESWRVVGVVTGEMDGASLPIVRIADERYVLRRQPAELTENDTLFRHAFMRHLRAGGLPVPALLQRSEGHTYAVVPQGIYELQGWTDGQPYTTDGPASDERLEQAAATLALLHQASVGFQWQRHTWPEERSSAAIAQAYITLIGERARDETLTPAMASALERIAETCEERLAAAVEALEESPRPPELHLHGDYQAHNLAFGPGGVVAVYDFDAAHWGRRIDELAYSLLYFAGVRWDDEPGVTPPLVDDGMDILRARRYLGAYGSEAPPAEGEARLLADALSLAFPVVFANGVAEDVIYPDDFAEPPDEEDVLARLQWADTFWLWLDRYRESLAQAWG